MSNDRYSNRPLLNISSKPADRESCKICNKFIYFHQPILFCCSCRNVFHGTCLKLSNNNVFVLQQIDWYCNNCYSVNEVKFYCINCFGEIAVSKNNISNCKQCRKLAHSYCLNDDICSLCTPASPVRDALSEPAENIDFNLQSDAFFKNQPIFSPFDFYEKTVVDFIPDADNLSEQLQTCNTVLNLCQYYKKDEFQQIENLAEFTASFVGINIDGVRTNFSKLKIIDREFNKSKKIYGYFICESNVTEDESGTFFLEGYNKFVLDRIITKNNVFKHKGSGLITFLSQSLERVKRCNEMCVSSPNFECLTLEVLTKQSKYLFINVYRSPSGNYEEFLKKIDEILNLANDHKDFKTCIFGDTNVNLYNPKSSRCREYLMCIFSNGFLPLISRATHFVSERPTCIDMILSNDITDISSSCILRAKVSHHLPTCLNINLDIGNMANIKSKPQTRINEYLLSMFTNDLKAIELDISINPSESAQDCFSKFLAKFKDSYDRWFIKTNDSNFRTSNNLRKDWITLGLAKSCLTR